MVGNNYETVILLEKELIELYNEYKTKWKSIDYTTMRQILEKYNFTYIEISFSFNTGEFESVLKKLKSLKKEFSEIEEQQKKDGLLSNSDMDKLIYVNYDDYISFAPYMYGKISDREIKNRRQLITDSIKYYKNLQNEK